jgi:hypothetical protein
MEDVGVDSRSENRDAALAYYQRRELDLLQKVDELSMEIHYLHYQLEQQDEAGTSATVSEG